MDMDIWQQEKPVVLNTWTMESAHNYNNNCHEVAVFLSPGATTFEVEFDDKCETETRSVWCPPHSPAVSLRSPAQEQRRVRRVSPPQVRLPGVHRLSRPEDPLRYQGWHRQVAQGEGFWWGWRRVQAAGSGPCWRVARFGVVKILWLTCGQMPVSLPSRK